MGIGKAYKNNFSFILGASVILSLLVVYQPVFAERQFSFEKTVDINKNTFQNSLTNLDSLKKIFPQNIKSVETKLENNEKLYAKMTFGFGGFSIDSDIELTNNENSTHTIEITSGGLSGTKLTANLTETWSYDGEPNQGTIVEIDMTLQTSGFLSLIGLAPDDAIIYSLDKSILDIVSYTKSKNGIEETERVDEITNDSDETKQNVLKRKFKR